jgi:hypothetical protein
MNAQLANDIQKREKQLLAERLSLRTDAEDRAIDETDRKMTEAHLATRFDAGETPWLTRQLLAMKAKVYEYVYADLKLRSVVSTNPEKDPWAVKVAYQEIDAYGSAKIIGPNAKIIPRVDVHGTETQSPIVTVAAAYGFELHEMKAAARQNGPKLSAQKPKAARRAVDETVNTILATGDTDSGLKGLFNHSSVTATAGSLDWSASTARQIFDAVMTHKNTVLTNTKGKFPVTKIGLPLSEYAAIEVLPWGSVIGSDPVYTTLTVLQHLKANLPGVEFFWDLALESISASKRMILFNDDSDVVEAEIPLDFEVLPPQVQGLDTVYHCVSRCGGIVVRQPKAMLYITGL